jgi:hypothetical protein
MEGGSTMNRDDIIRMAREAGWTEYSLLHAVELQRLETFAALVAAAEREACAKVCDGTRRMSVREKSALGGSHERRV